MIRNQEELKGKTKIETEFRTTVLNAEQRMEQSVFSLQLQKQSLHKWEGDKGLKGGTRLGIKEELRQIYYDTTNSL